MLLELIFASLMNAVNLAMLIDETRRRAKRSIPELKTPRGSIVFRQVHDLLHARRRRRLAPDARLLRRARDERVSVDAVGAPEGRPGLAPQLLEGVPDPLQRPVETLLANQTHVTIKI